MAHTPLFDVSKIDLDRSLLSGAELDEHLPQQAAMRHVDALLSLDLEEGFAVGLKEVGADEFWCAGHFPGWPVLPGVLMLEALAQLCTIYWRKTFDPEGRLMMFGGLDKVRFRGAVYPGGRLLLLLKPSYLRLRLSKFDCQALADGKVVCEATITGVLGPKPPVAE